MIDFQLQELNFTLFTEKFNPALLNLNTLQRVGAIKPNWQLAAEPVYQAAGIKLVFTNQVRIIAQPDRLVFAESVGKKRLQDTHLAETVVNYVQGFPEIKYLAVSLNPSGYAPFESAKEACKYLSEGLLASAPWGKFQGQPINGVSLKLAYPYKSGNFHLDINPASLDISGREIPAVWYAGNFNYQLRGADYDQKRLDLTKILENWRLDLENYQNYINNELLAVSVIPSVSIFPL
ncbi:MAG: hypothetical protein AAFR62_12345 [Cyanobacteria bacterium J06629_2]